MWQKKRVFLLLRYLGSLITHQKASRASIEIVNSAMQKLGYRPNAAARALVSQSTQTLGVWCMTYPIPFLGPWSTVDNIARKAGKHIPGV